MNTCRAVGMRIGKLLQEKGITLYRLEQDSGILHGTMMKIIGEKNKNITLKTVMQIASGFNMTLIEFLDDELFDMENIDLE
ncbi:MAG: helix-turn-helix transcriptional regulator [Clostridia bacterium]|nr:helix-turn-helix transcriptional regulator [Clostridia bacterium]